MLEALRTTFGLPTLRTGALHARLEPFEWGERKGLEWPALSTEVRSADFDSPPATEKLASAPTVIV
jgi:hypothetical protein